MPQSFTGAPSAQKIPPPVDFRLSRLLAQLASAYVSVAHHSLPSPRGRILASRYIAPLTNLYALPANSRSFHFEKLVKRRISFPAKRISHVVIGNHPSCQLAVLNRACTSGPSANSLFASPCWLSTIPGVKRGFNSIGSRIPRISRGYSEPPGYTGPSSS